MDISLIPKKEKEPFFGGKFTFLKILPFVLVLAGVYGGLWYYEQKLLVQKNDLNGEIKKILEERDVDAEKKVLLLDKQLKNLSQLLADHVYSSASLSLLEAAAYPRVRFKNFSVDASAAQIQTSGTAEGYLALAKQIVNFETHPDVLKAEISGIKINPDGKIDFEAMIDFKPEVLKYRVPKTTEQNN